MSTVAPESDGVGTELAPSAPASVSASDVKCTPFVRRKRTVMRGAPAADDAACGADGLEGGLIWHFPANIGHVIALRTGRHTAAVTCIPTQSLLGQAARNRRAVQIGHETVIVTHIQI